MSVYESPLDLGIKDYVETLAAAGVETFESCEGGESHTFPVPTIRFHGQRGEDSVPSPWPYNTPTRCRTCAGCGPSSEPVGPNWELTFYRRATSLVR